MYSCTRDNQNFHCPTRPLMMESRWNKSQIESAPNCPRCASSNTKFCYYNNYSFSQPRYFCKGCRRYWTKGGSLRNVPVGGGCRKSRRARSARLSDQRSGSSNYGILHNIDPVTNVCDSNTTDGVTIDLAAVFAKFLNQDSSKSNNAASSSSSDGLIPTSYDVVEKRVELEEYMFQSSQIDQSDFIDTGLPQMCVDVDGNSNSLELQAILGDEEVVPWSSDIGCWSNNLSNIGGPIPQLEFQDFGLFSSVDDESKIASQLPDDHWNSFDLSVYEIFTSP